MTVLAESCDWVVCLDVPDCDGAVARLLYLPEVLFHSSHPTPVQSDQQTLLNIHDVGFFSIQMTATGSKDM